MRLFAALQAASDGVPEPDPAFDFADFDDVYRSA